MRTREEIEKDMDALFVGGYRDRQITFTELRYVTNMLGKYRKELDELDMIEKTNNNILDKKNKLLIKLLMQIMIS